MDPPDVKQFKRAIARARRIMRYRSLGRRHSSRVKSKVEKFEITWGKEKPLYIRRRRSVVQFTDLHYCVVYPVDPTDRRRPYAKKVNYACLSNYTAKLNNIGYWIDREKRIRIRMDLIQSYIDAGTTYKILHENELDQFVKDNLNGDLSSVVYEQ